MQSHLSHQIAVYLSIKRLHELTVQTLECILQLPFFFPPSGTITSWVVIFILPINSALNPLLYTLTTRPFKEMIHQVWYNYRQRRSKKGRSGQKTYGPSLIWVEMWPMHEMTPKVMKPMLCTDSSDASVTSQSTRIN